MPEFITLPDVSSFLEAIRVRCMSPEIFTGLTRNIEAVKSEVWVPLDRKGQVGLQLYAVVYLTKKDEDGVGYYLEIELELTEPDEYHLLTWFLSVDPRTDLIVGWMKGEDIKSWAPYSGPADDTPSIQ